MKRKGLLKLLCATMLLAVTIVYLPSCSNDEEGSEYWTVTLGEIGRWVPNLYSAQETMVKVCFSVKMRLKVSLMKKVMSMYYVLKRLQRFNR